MMRRFKVIKSKFIVSLKYFASTSFFPFFDIVSKMHFDCLKVTKVLIRFA